jgi:hypothetical protein
MVRDRGIIRRRVDREGGDSETSCRDRNDDPGPGSCCCCSSVWGNDVRTDIGWIPLPLLAALSCPRVGGGRAHTYVTYLSLPPCLTRLARMVSRTRDRDDDRGRRSVERWANFRRVLSDFPFQSLSCNFWKVNEGIELTCTRYNRN